MHPRAHAHSSRQCSFRIVAVHNQGMALSRLLLFVGFILLGHAAYSAEQRECETGNSVLGSIIPNNAHPSEWDARVL